MLSRGIDWKVYQTYLIDYKRVIGSSVRLFNSLKMRVKRKLDGHKRYYLHPIESHSFFLGVSFVKMKNIAS